eukprot:487979-Amphidinium_carterae.1
MAAVLPSEESTSALAELCVAGPCMDPALRRRSSPYLALLDRMQRANMVEFVSHAPTECIGMFCVKKSDGLRQRLVIDARRANAHFKTPPNTSLPNGTSFGRISLGTGEPYGVCLDLKDAFYHMTLDAEFRDFFGMPGIPSFVAREHGLVQQNFKGSWAFPRLVVIPMGWNWALHLAQQAFEGLVRRSLNIPHALNDHSLCPNIHEGVAGVYVDNFIYLHSCRDKALSALDKVKRECAKLGLPTHGIVEPAEQLEVLVWEIDLASGFIRPKRSRDLKLWGALGEILRNPYLSPHQLETLLGHVTFVFLIRRPLRACLNAVYAFVHGAGARDQRRWLPLAIQREIRWVRSVLPLCFANLRLPISPTVGCSDASEWGYGWSRALAQWRFVRVCTESERSGGLKAFQI